MVFFVDAEYGFTQLEYSVYESRSSMLTFCLQVTGSIPQTDTANLTILTRTNGTANRKYNYSIIASYVRSLYMYQCLYKARHVIKSCGYMQSSVAIVCIIPSEVRLYTPVSLTFFGFVVSLHG